MNKDIKMNDENKLFLEAKTCYDNKEYQKAQKIFALLLDNNENNMIANMYYGFSLFHLKQYKLSNKHINRAEKSGMMNKSIAWYQYQNTVKLKNFDRALFYIDKLQDKLNSSQIYNIKGELFFRLNNLQKAAQYFDKSLTEDIKNISALINKGRTLLQEHEYDKAIVYFDEALKLDKNNQEASYFKNKVLLLNGNLGSYMLVQATEPNLFPIMESYYKLMSEHNYADAIEQINMALSYFSSHAHLYAKRAYAFFLADKYDDAIKDFNDAIRLNPNNSQYQSDKSLILSYKEKSLKAGNT